MKTTFDHNVKASFGLWLDNYLLRKGETYTNFAYPFTPTSGNLADYKVFKSPHSQWVYDPAIPNAQIPSGVWINNTFAPESSNVHLDFNNGRVFVKNSVNATNVSGAYAFKEVNVYFTQLQEEDLLFHNRFEINPRTKIINPSSASEHVIPAMYIQYRPGENEPFAFGGLDDTQIKIRTIFLADSDFLFEGVCGLLRDSVRTSIGYLEGAELPFNVFGGIKSNLYPFQYLNHVAAKTSSNGDNLLSITRVSVSPFSREVNAGIATNIVGGFIDFELSILRYPRQNIDMPPTVGANIYINALLGDDATAVRGDPNRPFKTLAAGMAAALDNDIIDVAEGQYT